jgi:hypothetical protein
MIPEQANAKTILATVRKGDLSPQEAEESATSRDLPPFAGKPDPQGFDPMTDPLLTIPTALARLISCSKGAVIESPPAWFKDRTLTDAPQWTADGSASAATALALLISCTKNAVIESPPAWFKDRTLTDAPQWTADGSASAAVAPDIHASQGGSTTDFASAAIVDPWAPSEYLTAGEHRVIIEAKRHWPDCKCLLRPEEVYSVILKNWDKANLGKPPTGEVTVKRALKKIPAWNAWREANLGKRTRGRRAVDKTFA